ncbi:C4b-binding protein beta chain [Cricetulus griseus]|uniref:C4b-binding protein beta chain n=1 Tax=Cricetulus griseus TaxID=10029 RepID=A0A9J7K8D9_CRIGR|nr:C4b-binding protein beta chain [Cricetulus griseus]XP_035301678.1 C4b-binding protein beta chain [Cricetulus griseus]
MLCWVVCSLMWLISALDGNFSELPPVDNSVFVAKEVEGQILGVYLCIKGYHLVGKQSLVLNLSEEWDDSPPECHLGHCPEPVLENGKTNYSGPVNINDKIMFKCNDGYILKGSNWSQCLEDHTWAPSLPICRNRDCGPPGVPSHGYFEGESFTAGSVVTYYCRDGYHLVGTQKLQCIDGEWSSSYPTCKSIQEVLHLAEQIALGKAILAFQESKDFCSATENFVRSLKESGLTMEELKYSLELKKTKLKADILLKHS